MSSLATALRTSDHEGPTLEHRLRVLFVIPGAAQGSSMIFARRQAESLLALGVDVECFFLRSRTSPLTLIKEGVRLRKQAGAMETRRSFTRTSAPLPDYFPRLLLEARR